MRACLYLALILLFPLGIQTASAQSVSGPYSFELVDERGAALPTFWKGGRTYVLGSRGQRYSLRIHNQSAGRVEFVSSVDGRDVLGGQPASWDKRGYIVAPGDEVVIDGFRLDHESVATFRFSSVKEFLRGPDGRCPGGWCDRALPSSRSDRCATGMVPRASGLARKPLSVARPGRPDDSVPFPRRCWRPRPAELGCRAPHRRRSSDGRSARERNGRARRSLAKKSERPGLGTEFGEQRSSHVDEVAFQRASLRPAATMSLRYNDREGLRAMGVNVDPVPGPREADLRETANPFPSNFCAPPTGWRR